MKRLFLLTIVCVYCLSVSAQIDSIKYKLDVLTSVSTTNKLPFWLVSNRNGIISENRTDLLYMSIFKDYTNLKTFDYSFGIDAATSYQYSDYAFINQYYASVKYSKLQLLIGAKNPEVLYHGLSFVDNSIIMAGNARTYPKIEISTLGYIDVPYTSGWLSFKGSFSNGLMLDNRYVDDVMLHHKNAYLRIGKDDGFSFELGVEHYAQWGGISPELEGVKDVKMPSDLDAFFRVLIAKEGGTYYNDMENSLGNHIGQNEIKFNYNTDSYKTSFYMRNMFEDRSQYFKKLFYKGITDIKDINYGLFVEIKDCKLVNSFLVEYYSTMKQGNIGHHSANVVVGYDNNFSNSIYRSGWTSYGRGLGIALNSPTSFGRDNSIGFKNKAFKAFNLGIQGRIKCINYKFKATYNQNYGSISDRNDGKPYEEWMTEERIYTYDTPQKQQHYLLELMMPEGKLPFDIYTSFGVDIGDMYNDNFGLMIKLSKTGSLSSIFK